MYNLKDNIDVERSYDLISSFYKKETFFNDFIELKKYCKKINKLTINNIEDYIRNRVEKFGIYKGIMHTLSVFDNNDINNIEVINIINKYNNTLEPHYNYCSICIQILRTFQNSSIFNIEFLKIAALKLNVINLFKKELNKFNETRDSGDIDLIGDILINLSKSHHSSCPNMIKIILNKIKLNKPYLDAALYEACHFIKSPKYTYYPLNFSFRGCFYPSIIYMLLEVGAEITFNINEVPNSKIQKILNERKPTQILNIKYDI